ncbi:protein IQ-DOMAIN 1 [Carica papaya]|uniref:protein IQ-DOMAIN 1 n=1 Tax=Carica papaya TaxID=3649 RepID=UPI000B8C876D|nr:protein IQ-DOMAIN 1 [Carica papaya]XP_021890230.1 protein IQ-DOMAIN 1 [Carica papaya]XP_021890231.1 protein IQ-DOMAIN 1 [Carica papaya]XP_021890232.1 protein IQ-DOMAIN 1 [Carica papaya]
MGSANCFRSLIGLKKPKTATSKPTKVNSTSEKSNEANSSGSNNLAIVGSHDDTRAPPVSVEARAAVRIQNAFRAFLARKQCCRRKGAVRFNILVQGNTVKKQTSTALGHIHSWCNIQSQIRARRLCMVTQGRIKQKKLENQVKLDTKLHELEVEWCGGSETMDEILARIQQREEAAVKRERAMAYAFSHQWRANPTQYLGQASYSLGKENWGWSWTERWVAARPWEVRVHAQLPKSKKGYLGETSMADKLVKHPDMKVFASVKPALSNGKETTKAKKGTPSNP